METVPGLSITGMIGLGIGGWAMWNVLLWGMAHDEADKNNKRFNFKKYRQRHIDDAIVSLLVGVPIVVWKNVFIWKAVFSVILRLDIPYDTIGLLGAGPLCQFLYFGAKWLFSAINKVRQK